MTSPAESNIILIQFTGHDHPGLTGEITGILARHKIQILDIAQSVVHESLALGILIASPLEPALTVLTNELSARTSELNLVPTFTAITPDALSHWQSGLSQQRFIITVLGRSITATHLARVASIVAAHQMNITRIDRLSRQLANDNASSNACIELAINGTAANEPQMRADFLAAAQELAIDIAFQRESIFRRNRRLFAFDMDSTLIQGEVIDELAKMAGVGDQVVKITEAAMRGELKFDESFTRRLGLLKGLPEERVLSLLDRIPLAEGAERLIRTLRTLGYKTVILSGGFNFFARSLQQRLGIDYIYANELEIIDGQVTGRVIAPIMNGDRKAATLAEIAAREDISLEQVVAVGDGANDIPMLKLAGMGIAYRAKPLVRQSAPQSVSSLGLDGLLYLIGVRDLDLPTHN